MHARYVVLGLIAMCNEPVSLQDRLVQWEFLRSWSPQLHKHYPAKFREVARCLVLATAKNNSGAKPGEGHESISPGECRV